MSSTSDLSPSATSSGRTADLRILLILSSLMAYAAASTDTYLPAFPAISAAFNADPGLIQLTLSSYLIGFSLGQLAWGPMGDRFGRRKPIIAGTLLFIAGSIGCALADSVGHLIVWRVVQALGACSGPVLARAMVRDLYARERSAQVLSTLLLIMGVAPLLGPIIGAQILQFASWRAIFWALVLFGALSLVSLVLLPETLPPSRRSPQRLSAVWRDYAMLLCDRKLLGYSAAGSFFYGGIFAYLAGSPFAYIEYYGVPERFYGFIFALNIFGMMGTNYLNTKLVMRYGTQRMFQVGAVTCAVAGVVLAMNARFGWGGLAGLTVPLLFYIPMSGFIVANSVAAGLSAFPRQAGAASAVIGTMQYGSGVVSAAVVGWFADGTPWPMGWVIGLCGVGCVLTSLLMVRGSDTAALPPSAGAAGGGDAGAPEGQAAAS